MSSFGPSEPIAQWTAAQIISQWAAPQDVSTVLMIIGGDVVQKALAQTTGCLYTPVVFSFGWVAYSFITLIAIIGDGHLLPPPEELSTSLSPRTLKPWQKCKAVAGGSSGNSTSPLATKRGPKAAQQIRGLPLGFWVTRIACGVLCSLWLWLLICVPALQQDSWYVLGIGVIGMFQNAAMAAMEVPPEARNLPLKRGEIIAVHKVMDGVMDLHATYGTGRPLLGELFSGRAAARRGCLVGR
ncbi:hypothetical protein PspLS_08442 [Pyricularia sp. CBS 133598]|nr:hypothetical protein PspLS_08442 [Pyricularia sp. CBS 133598]